MNQLYVYMYTLFFIFCSLFSLYFILFFHSDLFYSLPPIDFGLHLSFSGSSTCGLGCLFETFLVLEEVLYCYKLPSE